MSRFVWQARWVLLLTIPVMGSGCGEEPSASYLGIWQGTWEDRPLSVEFRADGRAILVSGCEDGIILAGYSIDEGQRPAHLDIAFDNRSWGIVRTLVEMAGPGRIRVQHLDADTARPAEFTPEAIVLDRAKDHVLPRGVASAEGLREALAKALKGDIWFGGERREPLLDICEALFRHQFDHNASAVQKDASAYFLAFGAANAPKDPGADFLKRFADVGKGGQIHAFYAGFGIARV